MVSRVIPVDPFDLVIFGGTGDLARRKILPALFRRFCDGQMPREARIIGAARTRQSAGDWAAWVGEALEEIVPERLRTAEHVAEFLDRLDYLAVDAKGDDGWSDLCDTMRADAVQAFYFSVAPSLFGDLAERLHQFGIARSDARIVVEKPFGNDLASAKALNRTLSEYFDETQIYRIDHYLGKETVQNLMAVRFGNVLFEPLWNTQYVDHVQITVAEEVGVGGRGAYYDQSGAMRDMVQNHLMQLLCLTAMEPPSKFDPDAVRDEKLKVIRALDPVEAEDIVRGQYKGSKDAPSYVEDAENPESRTESFIAIKLHIANWRWNGTPFYLRTGKRLRARKSEIVIHFKEPPHSIFDEDAGEPDQRAVDPAAARRGDRPARDDQGTGTGGDAVDRRAARHVLSPRRWAREGTDVPDAYERLIMDVIRGQPDAVHARRRGGGGLGLDRSDHRGLDAAPATGRRNMNRAVPDRRRP